MKIVIPLLLLCLTQGCMSMMDPAHDADKRWWSHEINQEEDSA